MNRSGALYLARSSLRFFARHPAQLALSFVGIVLGVGIVTAVLITNASSQRAFALSSEALYGRTSHQLLGADGVDGRDYAALRRALPDLRMAPVVEGEVAIGGELFSLLGLDPFAEAGFERTANGAGLALDSSKGVADDPSGRGAAGDGDASDASADSTGAAGAAEPLVELLLANDALAISGVTRDRLDLPLDVPLAVEAGGRRHALRLVGTFSSANPAASEGMLLADIALAQDILGLGGAMTRVDLILDGDTDIARVSDALPPTLRLAEAASRERTMRAMTRGFQINLTAMSLLALVVGAFLIHNTMTFAVLQRRELFANLRITGVTARALLGSVLLEAVVIGTAGALAGLALGWALAHALIRLTTRTINDLYFVLHVQEVSFGPWLAVGGLALGIGASVLAAAVSALDAAGTSPGTASRRSIAESRARAALPRFALAGLAAMLIGAGIAFAPLQSLVAGFAALMLLILGYGLALPQLVAWIARAISAPAARLGTAFALAAGGIERNISRTGLAIAALAIAVSATFGVEVMITSFRTSVDDWLGTTLRSDLYVSAPSTVSTGSATVLDPRVLALARETPGIADVSTARAVDVATSVGQIDLLVLDPHAASIEGFEFLATGSTRGAGEHAGAPADTADGPAGAWTMLLADDALLISEPLATKHGLAPGDTIGVFTAAAGERPFTVAAVVRDYGSSHGRLTMSRAAWSRWWNDDRISSLGLLVTDGAEPAEVLARLRSRLASVGQPLSTRSNDAIHDDSLEVFDRTFEVTRVLRWLTVGVAFVGIFSALLALHLERAREFAVLRATGATRGQIATTVAVQTLLMGLLAGLLSLPLGWGMSEILIRIINVRSFGWSMQSHLPPDAALSAVGLACLSAVLAGVWPAWRLARADVAGQLRDE